MPTKPPKKWWNTLRKIEFRPMQEIQPDIFRSSDNRYYMKYSDGSLRSCEHLIAEAIQQNQRKSETTN